MKRVCILGSTGSVGTQTLDVVRKHPDHFEVVALVAGRNAELLAQQVDEFAPAMAVLADAAPPPGTYFETGFDAVIEAARYPECDVVVNALVGSRGLRPTLAAIDAGKTVALANKETLVAGGELVTAALGGRADLLVPVDSEHSGVFQCLAGTRSSDVRRIVLTASGGPFRGRTRADLATVTVEQALAHPTWRMGPKNTVDSATLINKGLELIEAHHLFGVTADRIDVVVHPSSIVHAIVEFVDGSAIMQAATPDMRLPIQVALAWPARLPDGAEPLEWAALGELRFEPLDAETFPSVELARAAVRAGGTAPAVLNAANEEAVDAFLDGRLAFTGIWEIVEQTLEAHDVVTPLTLDALDEAEAWARASAAESIGARA